ncbi:MAG: AMP-binding protein, partial [bacterium]|nr:AMP-binding protein [bacterium]
MTPVKDNKIKHYPLTHAQKRIYYDDMLFPGTSVSTQAFEIKFRKLIDFELMTKTLNDVIRKNDGFRLRVIETEEHAQQYVAPFQERPFDYFDFSAPGGKEKLHQWIETTTQTPIPLIDSELYYFALLKFSETESGYYMKFHHIASDGWSYAMVFDQIKRIYEALEAGDAVDDRANPSYIEYISDEKEYMESPQFEASKAFWHEHLLPLPQNLSLAAKNGDPGDISGKVCIIEFPDEIRTQIHDYRKANKSSLYKVLLSALSLYIAKSSGVDDVVIAGVNHNRFGGKRKGMVGMFVSTVPQRIKINCETTFAEFVGKTGNDTNSIIKNHQQYPFDILAAQLRDAAGTDVGYLLNVFISGHPDFPKESYEFEHIFQGYLNNLISVHINAANKDIDGILELEYEYQTAHLDESDIRRVHQGVLNVLTQTLANPELTLSRVEILSKAEKKQLLSTFNNTETEFPREHLIHQLFEEQVAATPGNTAVIHRQSSLTYKELNEKANQLARLLRQKGLKPDSIVGIMTERSLETIIAVLGVLKAGGAYLPMSRDYSVERVHYMLEDSQCRMLLIKSVYKEAAESFSGEMIFLDDNSTYSGENANIKAVNNSRDLAVAVYTPGYKGQSKGVMVEHISIVNSLIMLQKRYPAEKSSTYLFKTLYRFDVAVPELFSWGLGGAKTAILEEGAEHHPQKLLDAVQDFSITHLNMAPSMLIQLINYI